MFKRIFNVMDNDAAFSTLKLADKIVLATIFVAFHVVGYFGLVALFSL